MSRKTLLRLLIAGALLTAAPSPASATTIYFNTVSPDLFTWNGIAIPLSGNGWVVDDYNGGVTATQAQIQYVLANLQAMYILVEWRTGPDDTHVDNVAFGSGASTNFSSSLGGWFAAGPDPGSDIADQVVPTMASNWDSSFGNPAGSLNEQDFFYWHWIGAPSTYLGNQSARYGEMLTFDMYIRYTDGVSYPMVALVAPDPVPEPATLTLVGIGLLGVAAAARRRAVRRRQ